MEIIIETLSQNPEFIIGSLALYLAVIGYVVDQRAKYKNLESLLLSFKNELEFQSAWLSGVYSNEHQDKKWFSPAKIVFVLSFETAKELSRRGVFDEKTVPNEFYKKLAIFNERIDAFNNAVMYQQNLIAADPNTSEKLIDYLDLLEKERKVNFCDVYKKIYSKDYGEIGEDVKNLAKQLFKGNKIIHSQLIGGGNLDQHLNCLHKKLSNDIDSIVENYEARIPFLIREINKL